MIKFEFICLDYKELVKLQLANGVFRKEVLNFLTDTQGEINKQRPENISDNAWLTLLGLYLFEKIFRNDKPKWKFVAQKSKKWLVSELKLDSSKVDEMMHSIKIKTY